MGISLGVPGQTHLRGRAGQVPLPRWLPGHRPAGAGARSCLPLGPARCLAGIAPAPPLTARRWQRGMVLGEHSRRRGGSSIPPAKLKPKPAPAPPPLEKIPGHIFFFLIPSENCSSNLTPAEPPLGRAASFSGRGPAAVNYPTVGRRLLSFSGAFFGVFQARGIAGCGGLAAMAPFAAARHFFALVR